MIFGHGIQMNDDKVREILAKDPAIQTAFRELDVAIKARNENRTGRAVRALQAAIDANEPLRPVMERCGERGQPSFCNIRGSLVGITSLVIAGLAPGKDRALAWRAIDNSFQRVANYFAPTGARDVGRLKGLSKEGLSHLNRDLQGVVGSYLTGTDESMSLADQQAAMKAKHGQAKPLFGGRRKTRKGKSKKTRTRRR